MPKRKLRTGPPPIVGKCPKCRAVFNSAYALKRHECGAERSPTIEERTTS